MVLIIYQPIIKKVEINQNGGGINQKGGNYEVQKNKIIDIYDSLPQDKVTIVYNHWKNNSPFEATRKYNDEQYTKILNELQAVVQQKLGSNKDDALQEAREEILKIPGIIVKVTDWYEDVNERGYNSKSNENYVNVIGNTCVSVGGSGTGCGDYKKYGPFRYTVGPQENKNPTNGQIFNYLVAEDKYNIKQILTPKGNPKSKFPTGKEPNIKLFGYGFSGSGKTFTLLQGSETDKSLFVETLQMIKESENLEVGDIDIKIFYPKDDNTLKDTKRHFYNKKGIGKTMKDEIAKVLEKLRTIGKNKSHSENDVREIKQRLEEVENILLKYLLVLPTSNNPRSSRAFTIVKIILTNGSSVMFIDLPGLEKK